MDFENLNAATKRAYYLYFSLFFSFSLYFIILSTNILHKLCFIILSTLIGSVLDFKLKEDYDKLYFKRNASNFIYAFFINYPTAFVGMMLINKSISIIGILNYEGFLPKVGSSFGFLSIILTILLSDLCIYLYHMFSHKSKLLWETGHKIHHLTGKNETTQRLLLGLSDIILMTFIIYILVTILIGYKFVETIAFIGVCFSVYIHSASLYKGPKLFKYILNSPYQHSFHHKTINSMSNYSTIFIFYDYIFKTIDKDILNNKSPTNELINNYIIFEKIKVISFFKNLYFTILQKDT